VFIVLVIIKTTGASCSFTSNIQCVHLAAEHALSKCVVTEVVLFSVAFKTLTFHKAL